jgi:hypothetical protein
MKITKPSFSTSAATAFVVLYLASAAVLFWSDLTPTVYITIGAGTLCGLAWIWKHQMNLRAVAERRSKLTSSCASKQSKRRNSHSLDSATPVPNYVTRSRHC